MPVRLLHWNILFSEKPLNIKRQVEELRPDVFCCQEISDQDGEHSTFRLIAAMFEHHYFEPADIITPDGKAMHLGNAIFSKFPISQKQKLMLWNQANPTSGNKHEQRIYVEATITIGGRELIVGTTHLSFAPQFGDTPDRLAQAKALMSVIKDKNYVITGDFNSAPQTKIIKDIKNILVSAGPDDEVPSFTTIPFSYLGFDVTGLDWRVDYVFTSPDIKTVSSKIVETKFSDHLPILAELDI